MARCRTRVVRHRQDVPQHPPQHPHRDAQITHRTSLPRAPSTSTCCAATPTPLAATSYASPAIQTRRPHCAHCTLSDGTRSTQGERYYFVQTPARSTTTTRSTQNRPSPKTSSWALTRSTKCWRSSSRTPPSARFGSNIYYQALHTTILQSGIFVLCGGLHSSRLQA